MGNSRVKLGWFPVVDADCATKAAAGTLPIAGPSLPEPAETFAAAPDELGEGALAEWLAGLEFGRVVLASVSQSAEKPLVAAFDGQAIERVTSESAPIELRVDEPAKIGVDRVLAAVAANRLRHADKPAIVVDVGTAITVDLVATNGALEGGAILPGPGLAARALAEKTDALPDIRFGELDASPDAVGRSTEPAIRAGIYWGCVGAVRELIARQRDRLVTPPQVFLTGGAAPAFARLIGGPDLTVRCLPHLTLSGVAIAAESGAAS
ncbi:Type III pantothenate kinase [Planctomycetes bacterium MalM25]|nr:Type III pantothenate kinase [Planctomycetes bacterium MalM25]